MIFYSAVLCLLYFISVTYAKDLLHDMVDPSGWNYDRETKSFKSASNGKPVADPCKQLIEQLIEKCPNEVQRYCKVTVEPEQPIMEPPKPVNKIENLLCLTQVSACDGNEMRFMKRFIHLLLQSAHLSSFSLANGGPSSGLVDIRVTEEDLKILERFGHPEEDISLRQLDTVMSRVVHSGLHMSKDYFTWMDNIFFFLSLREVWLWSGAFCITMFVLWLLLSGHPFTGTCLIFFMLIFMASYVMEFYRLFKEAEVEQLIILKKHSDIPPACRPGDRSWVHWFLDSLTSVYQFKSDECQKYYSALTIDPMAKVSPARVLSNIMADLVLAPAHKVGEAIAAFTSSLMGNLPPLYGWIILAFSSISIFILILIALLRLFGGRVRFSTLLFGVEIGGDNEQVKGNPSLGSVGAEPSKGNSSPHPMIETLNSISKSNLVIIGSSSLKELISQSSRPEDVDLNVLQHRQLVESIHSPSLPSVTKENNMHGEELHCDKVGKEVPAVSKEGSNIIKDEVNNEIKREDTEILSIEFVDRTAKQYICSGGGDASSGK
ncbi:uncharacterized protein [Anabrus simplex]|uniref:uncharacterized protein n=1 Tax=Anabrus simplex TaxID=316456 RepID=UPI0035A34F2F